MKNLKRGKQTFSSPLCLIHININNFYNKVPRL